MFNIKNKINITPLCPLHTTPHTFAKKKKEKIKGGGCGRHGKQIC